MSLELTLAPALTLVVPLDSDVIADFENTLCLIKFATLFEQFSRISDCVCVWVCILI